MSFCSEFLRFGMMPRYSGASRLGHATATVIVSL